MLRRLTHAAIAFAVTVLAYQAYVLAVVPFVEPNVAVRPRRGEGEPDVRQPRETPNRYHDLLAAYFPPGHWCLQQPPIAFENGQALVVVDGVEKYTQSDDGKLRVPKCVIVFFPRPRDRTAAPPRDAIILDPSGGATLQMEERLDPAVSSFGRMQFGQLLGDLTVRSDMREPGPQDDLLITTRDLYMNEDLIQTTEPVELRLGQHLGRGRGLEIRFLPSESASPSADTPIYGQLDSLEVTHEVSAVIVPDKLKLAMAPPDDNGSAKDAASSSSSHAKDKLVDAPIRIQSAGPFRINFGSMVASFIDRVQVRQLHPDGKLDELQANELNLFFTKSKRWNADAMGDDNVTPTPEAPQEASESFVLEPETLEAIGSEGSPVRLNAPSQEAVAVGEHLYIELTDRRVTLQRGEEVTLSYRGAEIHAPMVQYELPPKNSPERIGVLRARGGFGKLTAVPDPKRPDQVLEVTWKDSMQLVRSGGQPVLKLDGRPRVTMTTVGTLYADRLELFLRDDPNADPGPDGSDTHALPSSIRPERLAASDHVVIQSPELNGKVNRLNIKFDYPQPGATPTAGGAPPVPTGEAASAAGRPPINFGQHQPGARTYDIAGVELKLNVAVRDRHPEVTRIRVDGAAVFQESATQVAGEPPLRISAERLEVTDADTPNAKIDIRGAGGQNGLPFQVAEVSARGTIIRAPQLTINRGTGQASVNSPGEVQMTMNRDVTGQPLAQPQPVTITWQESMKLEGDLITFLGDVRVQNPEGWLRTRRLSVKLTAPVRFDGVGGQQPPQLAAVRCDEGAVAEFDQHDEAGALVAHQRVELQWLQANQLTGEITGSGPGHIDSLHFSRGASRLFADPAAAGDAPVEPAPGAADDGPPQLRHLSLDFLRDVTGNLNAMWISVSGDVKTVYGPVDSWDQRLTMTVGGRPEKDTFWINCQRLQVARSPLSGVVVAADGTRKPINQVELLAEGKVVIEGEAPERGAFTMRGHRASYDQPKTQFILEGDGRELAVITHQQSPGAAPSDQSFKKLYYYQNTGDVTFQDIGQMQLRWNDFNQGKNPEATQTR